MASELWEKLTARCVDQHRHIERTLEQLLEIKGAMEELSTTLDQAESVRETWEPIGDLFIDSLPEHIQSTKVLVALRRLHLAMEMMKCCFPGGLDCSVQGSLINWDLRAKASFPQPPCFVRGVLASSVLSNLPC